MANNEQSLNKIGAQTYVFHKLSFIKSIPEYFLIKTHSIFTLCRLTKFSYSKYITAYIMGNQIYEAYKSFDRGIVIVIKITSLTLSSLFQLQSALKMGFENVKFKIFDQEYMNTLYENKSIRRHVKYPESIHRVKIKT